MLICNLRGPNRDREFKLFSSWFKDLSLFQDTTHKSLLALGKGKKGRRWGRISMTQELAQLSPPTCYSPSSFPCLHHDKTP